MWMSERAVTQRLADDLRHQLHHRRLVVEVDSATVFLSAA